jgi:DNA-binding transcriptional regulator YiaG
MTVAFRNVEGSPELPVGEWPYEALVACIERGTLGDWLPIIREIRRLPWGTVARQVETYLGYTDPYGVGPLLRRAVASARHDAEAEERAIVAGRVRELVEASGLSRAEFAREIGTSRSRLSTYCTGTVSPSAALLVRMERVAQAHGAGA